MWLMAQLPAVPEQWGPMAYITILIIVSTLVGAGSLGNRLVNGVVEFMREFNANMKAFLTGLDGKLDTLCTNTAEYSREQKAAAEFCRGSHPHPGHASAGKNDHT